MDVEHAVTVKFARRKRDRRDPVFNGPSGFFSRCTIVIHRGGSLILVPPRRRSSEKATGCTERLEAECC